MTLKSTLKRGYCGGPLRFGKKFVFDKAGSATVGHGK
jgi:hypothetical protein